MTEQQRLFTYQSIDNIDRHKVIQADNAAQAEELVSTGKAVKLDLPELTALESKADAIYDKYTSDVDAIKASDNPLMTDEVKKYEIAKLDEAMRNESAEVEQEYQTYRRAQQDDARKRAATAVIGVSDADRTVADQMVTRYTLRLASALSDETGAIASDLTADIAHLSDGEKAAVQKAITPILSQFERPHMRTIVEAAQDVRNADILAEKVASQLPVGVLTKLRRHDVLKGVRK